MKTHLLWTAIFVLLFSLGCSGGKKKTGTLCQADNDCTGGGLCLGGTCVALTACTSQSECGNGVCSQGYCWSEACGGDGAQSCPDYAECLEGYCVRKSSETDATDGKDTSSENECNVDTDCSAKLGTLGSCEKPSCLNGVCLKVKKAEGDSCDDGDACTTGDKCDASGVCVPGTYSCECKTDSDCAKLDDACNQGACDLTNYSCVKLPINEGNSCNDGNACTAGETCQSGVCSGGTNPCSVANDPCKNGGICTVKNGSPSCDYSQNDKKPCDDKRECTGPQDLCDGSTGTCVGANMPIGTPCTLVAGDVSFCGFYGDCATLTPKVITPDPSFSAFTLGSVCWAGGTAPAYAMLTYMTDNIDGYGDSNYAFYKLDNGQITPAPSLGKFQLVVGPPTMLCTASLAVLYTQYGDPGLTIAANVGGTWTHEDPSGTPNNNTNFDELLAAFFQSPTGAQLQWVSSLVTLGTTTWIAGSLYSYADNSRNHLIKCTTTECQLDTIGSLGTTGDENWWNSGLYGEQDSGNNLLWLLGVDDYTSSWYISAFDGGSWSEDCDGSVTSSACYSKLGYWNGVTLNRGFNDIHGTKGDLWVVGEAIQPRITDSFPLSKTTACTPENEALVCASGSSCVDAECPAASSMGRLLHSDGNGWTELPPIPAKRLLKEPSSVKVDAYDYVYKRVRRIQGGAAVMIQGFYRACIDPTNDATDDCFTTDRNVLVKKRPFVVFYYPGTKSWSPMYPVGDGSARTCCVGGTCPQINGENPWECGEYEFYALWGMGVSGLGIRDAGGSTQLYLLENRIRTDTCTMDSDCPSTDDSCSVGYCKSNLHSYTTPVLHYLLSNPPSN